jgi:hypothetical protein
MRLSSGIRRVSFLALSVGVFVATVPMIYGGDDQTVTLLKVVRQRPVATTENQQAPPSPAQAPNGNPDATAFASLALREVSQLHEGITLAKWMDTRGKGEHWESTEPEIVPTQPHLECLSLVKTEALPSGTKITRALYFYPPSAPSPAVFPTSSGPELISTCTLGMIRVEAEAPTPEIGHVLAQAAREQLARQYGESIGMKKVAFWGPGYYDAARWIHDAEIVSGYDAKPGLNLDAPDQLVRGHDVFVRARLPLVQTLEHEDCCTIKAYHYRPIEKAHFHRAIAMAGVDAVLSGRLEKLYKQAFQSDAFWEQAQRPEKTKWRESLLPALGEWLSALKNVPPAQRAAGLLAADRLLGAAERAGRIPGWPEKPAKLRLRPQPEKRSELQKLGAVFELNGIASYYFYTRNWEKQARELDPNGTVGQMAVIGSLARGSCDIVGSDFFRRVVLDGEGLLAKGLDAHTSAQVHFMVGDAYSDIVAIAGGDAGPNGEYDPEKFLAEADTDRAKALRHYRAGLAVDNTSENAKDAWHQAWHLSAGLLPSERYVCFGD